MPNQKFPLTLVFTTLVFAVALAVGCDGPKTSARTTQVQPPKEEPLPPAPLWRAGTVAEVASLEGAMNVRVGGYGLVVGLGKSGSGLTGVAPQVQSYLTNYLLKKGAGRATLGMANIQPEMILRDTDSAIVVVVADVPALAPVGTRYDLVVQALPQTQTTNLQGGFLMPIDLYLAPGGILAPTGAAKTLATAAGQMFVNPFLDPNNPKDAAKFREARILNGGIVTRSAPIRLVLRRPDYGLCRQIQGRINERFPTRGTKVANALTQQWIELTVPPEYAGDYIHFLNVVLHVPLKTDPRAWEAKAKEIGQAISAPGANYEELSMVWEAMGKSILPMVKTLYTSPNVAAAYYAARTGLRMGDVGAMEVLVHHARDPQSPVRLAAIEEMGQHPDVLRGEEDLQALVDDPVEAVRVAAYEAMIRRNDHDAIQRTDLGTFCLDQVKAAKQKTIYATQSGVAKIVLMGQDMPLQKEIYYASPGGDVVINAGANSKELTAVRRIPRTGKYSDPVSSPRDVVALVRMLGGKVQQDAKGEVASLGLSYSQVIGVLHGMCKQHDIDANFVLQQPLGMRKIGDTGPTAVRPDLPVKSREDSGPELPKK